MHVHVRVRSGAVKVSNRRSLAVLVDDCPANLASRVHTKQRVFNVPNTMDPQSPAMQNCFWPFVLPGIRDAELVLVVVDAVENAPRPVRGHALLEHEDLVAELPAGPLVSPVNRSFPKRR